MDFSLAENDKMTAFGMRALCRILYSLGLYQLRDRLLPEKYESYYRKRLFREIAGSDGIIFSGGSFKYGTQDVWAQYSAIIDYADKHNIPVMFDAMNVQKFDGTDFRCQYLKEHLNRKCVKYFTSRDGQPGVERLKQDYAENGELKIFPAADPAFWIPETYHVERNKNSDVIGVNVIAPNRFQVYGGTLRTEEVKAAYITMLDKLTEHGFSWQLFTNGMKEDGLFAFELAEHYGLPEHQIHIPASDTELANMEANYKAVFGARLHSMICAYSLGVPVAGFIWDEKITHFAEMAKLEELFLKESDVTGTAMFDVLMKALNKKDDPENRDLWKAATKTTIFDFLDEVAAQNSKECRA